MLAYNMSNMIHAIIPISKFNKGEAGRIFEEVTSSGIKIVVKNNKPACVLIDPEEYLQIMEKLEDYELLLEAEKRMDMCNLSASISHEEIMRDLGINPEDLEGDVEIE